MIKSLALTRCLTIAVLSATAACRPAVPDNQPGHSVPGADADRGKVLLTSYGCGSCHSIPGVRQANGTVGPPLDAFDKRIYVAGVLPNQLEPLMQWIMDPQRVIPGNAMPNMHVSVRDARNMAAYLYTLR